jgi:hypothetical protein
MHTTLLWRVAGGYHAPVLRKPVFSEPTVQNELVAGRLGHLRSRGKFVEK